MKRLFSRICRARPLAAALVLSALAGRACPRSGHPGDAETTSRCPFRMHSRSCATDRTFVPFRAIFETMGRDGILG